jgi:hypothetical protein
MIVEAPRNMYDITSFSFPGIHHPAMSMPITRFGPVKKMVIAARFNISVPVGWPELQIIRRASDGISNVAVTTSTIEPKPTGYLNLYEYDLTAKNFDIRVGDKLNITWHGNILQHDQIRFSLAYYSGTSPIIPMVSVVFGDYDSNITTFITSTLGLVTSTKSDIDISEVVSDETSTTATVAMTSTDITIDSVSDAYANTSTTASTATVTEGSTNQASTNQISLITNDNIKIISGVI